MDLEFPRRLFDVGFTRNSIATSFSSDQNRILIDVEPQSYGDDDDSDEDDDSDSSAPLARPFLFLDMIWNLAFVVVSVFALLVSLGERPSTPLRLWVCGYALQCLLHVGFMWDEYQTRSLDDVGNERVFLSSASAHHSIIKKLESVNTIVSSVWWVFGFYWIVIGGQPLLQDSPRLYWLSVVFLAFDVFFMIFCVVMACIIVLVLFCCFPVLFCCFPVLATVAYAIAIGDGASENDIRSLPKYLYRPQNNIVLLETENKQEVSPTALEGNVICMADLVLQPEDSECCICLFKYVDGAELCTLPCNHHFHHKCITKWLRINSTCPLCKFNILRGDKLV